MIIDNNKYRDKYRHKDKRWKSCSKATSDMTPKVMKYHNYQICKRYHMKENLDKKNLKHWKRQFILTSRRSKTSKSRSQSGRPESGANTSKLPLLLTLVSFLDIMVLSNETSFNISNHENIIWYLRRTTLMSWEITYFQCWTGAVSHST